MVGVIECFAWLLEGRAGVPLRVFNELFMAL